MCFWTIYSSQNPEKKTDFSFDIIKKDEKILPTPNFWMVIFTIIKELATYKLNWIISVWLKPYKIAWALPIDWSVFEMRRWWDVCSHV